MHDGKTGCHQGCEKKLFVQTEYKYIDNIFIAQENIIYFF
jgi:hypothetical protein